MKEKNKLIINKLKSTKKVKIVLLENNILSDVNIQKISLSESNIKIQPRSKIDIKEGMIRYRPTKQKGLTTAQVTERMYSGLINRSVHKNKKTVPGIIFSNICTFFNLLCALVAVSLIYVEAYRDLVFLMVVLLNTGIGIIQEIKAKNIIDKLTLSSASYAAVIRNGKKINVAKTDIVLDDILVLDIGGQICADCYVIDGSLEVNESLLTGESLPVKHTKGDLLLAGSFVSSGSCYARVENVGKENYIEKLSSRAKKYSKPKSELMYSMNTIIRVIGVVIIPLAILTALNNFRFFGGDIYQTVTKTAGSIIGMIPAGMFLLTSMALAVGVIRLGKKRTLVQELYCIEMLARANVLCLDKTGTLTDGSMKVSQVIPLGKSAVSIEKIMCALLDTTQTMNATAQALKNHFSQKNTLKISEHIDFSSEKKFSGVSIARDGKYKLGACEYVLDNIEQSLQLKIDEMSKKGFRVVVLAKCESFEKMSGTPIALLALEDNIRKDAPSTIKWFKENNVDIKVISGDNPLTVSEIARRCGIDNHDKYISLQNLSRDEVIRSADKYTVFGRVSPEQKAILVKALKARGKTVAMTGDGVNDILALKEADCSIAIAAGSEAARSVSHLVLLDSDFSSMPSVVSEGRRVVNNISKSSSLFLMKTLFVMCITIFVLIYQKTYPFSTIQFFLLETLVIGIPSFFLALQPNDNIIKGKFLANVFKSALPAGIVLTLNVIAVYFFQSATNISTEVMVTMGSIAMTAFGLIALFHFCRPFNIYKGVLYASCTFVAIALVTIIPTVFYYVPLNLEQVLFVMVIVLLSNPLYVFLNKGMNSIKVSELKPINYKTIKLKGD